MAITFVTGAVPGSANLTTSFTITIPTVQVDDLLLLATTNGGATAAPTVTDNDTGGNTWTRKSSTAVKGQIYYKRATSATSAKTITASGFTNSCSGVLLVIRGAVFSGDPFNQFTTEENAAANETHAGFTPTVNGCWIGLAVCNGASNGDVAVTSMSTTSPGSLQTNFREHLSTGGVDCACAMGGAVQATAGATGNFTWAQTDLATTSYAFAIAPAATGTLGTSGSSSLSIDATAIKSTDITVAGSSAVAFTGDSSGGGVIESTAFAIAGATSGTSGVTGNLLLHMDGADASTTFTDSSSAGHTVSPQADAQIDTAQSKFGGASVFFDGTGDCLKLDGSSDFAFDADFTVDFWVRQGTQRSQFYYDARGDAGAADAIAIYDDGISLAVFKSGTGNVISATRLGAGTWNHIALTRSGSSLRLFVDGVQAGSTHSTSATLNVGTNGPVIGAGSAAAAPLHGWIDELRVVKGAAVWTSNFTPPTSPYGEIAYVGTGILSGVLSVSGATTAAFVGSGLTTTVDVVVGGSFGAYGELAFGEAELQAFAGGVVSGAFSVAGATAVSYVGTRVLGTILTVAGATSLAWQLRVTTEGTLGVTGATTGAFAGNALIPSQLTVSLATTVAPQLRATSAGMLDVDLATAAAFVGSFTASGAGTLTVLGSSSVNFSGASTAATRIIVSAGTAVAFAGIWTAAAQLQTTGATAVAMVGTRILGSTLSVSGGTSVAFAGAFAAAGEGAFSIAGASGFAASGGSTRAVQLIYSGNTAVAFVTPVLSIASGAMSVAGATTAAPVGGAIVAATLSVTNATAIAAQGLGLTTVAAVLSVVGASQIVFSSTPIRSPTRGRTRSRVETQTRADNTPTARRPTRTAASRKWVTG